MFQSCTALICSDTSWAFLYQAEKIWLRFLVVLPFLLIFVLKQNGCVLYQSFVLGRIFRPSLFFTVFECLLYCHLVWDLLPLAIVIENSNRLKVLTTP